MDTERNAIGLVELSCIHKKSEVLDRVLMSAYVEKLLPRPYAPGST